MNISTLFFQTAQKIPDAPAISGVRTTLSYRDFESGVRTTAAYFKAKGLKAGDRVLVFVPMSEDLYRVVMAIFQLGATAVFLDEWVSLDRLRLCCRLANCQAFIAPWKFRLVGFFVPEIRAIPLHLSLGGMQQQGCEDIFPAHAEDVALLTFTTGSTGTPKAASRSHGFLLRQFEALIEEIQPGEGDTVMTNLPIVMLINFGTGACSVIAQFNAKKPWKFQPEPALELIRNKRVNVVIGSPFLMIRLADIDGNSTEQMPVKKVFTGGGPVFPDEAASLIRAFPEAQVHIVYGSTEAEPIATMDARQLASMEDLVAAGGLCVGDISSRISLKIIAINQDAIRTEEFEGLDLPAGALGEIVVAGDHVLRTYWNNEAAFRQNKIVDATGRVWHRTGDAGFVHQDGQLYLTGRCNQMICRHESWISPFIAEYLLRQSPAFVAGTILDMSGTLVVVVQPTAWMDAEALQHHVRQCLPYPVDTVFLLEKIPRDPRHYSKLDYEKIRERISRTADSR